MTDTELYWWVKAMQATLTLEAKVGEATKEVAVYQANELEYWVKSRVAQSESFVYWLATVKDDNLTRKMRSYFYECDLLDLAERCLFSFERAR